MIFGADISNLQGPPSAYEHTDWFRDVRFIITQAIQPPPGYPGHDFIDPETGTRGYTGVQLRHAKQHGKLVGAYIWLWHGLADLHADYQRRLATIPQSVKLDMRLWQDVEDTNPNVTPQQRRSEALAGWSILDQWANGRSQPVSGGYTGRWYIDGYLGGWWPDRPTWLADYGQAAGAPVRGNVVAHQYTSDPVDLNVMLESEFAEQPQGDLQAQLDERLQVMGYLVGDATKPLRRRNAAAYVKAVVKEIDRVADQFGLAHP